MIESENDAGLHRDAVSMKAPDDLAVFGGAVVAFVRDVEAGLRNGFQAEEERLASAPRGEGEEFVVERNVGRTLAGPPPFQRRDGREEFLRVGVFAPMLSSQKMRARPGIVRISSTTSPTGRYRIRR